MTTKSKHKVKIKNSTSKDFIIMEDVKSSQRTFYCHVLK